MTGYEDLPAVMFDADICKLLDLKLRTLQKQRKAGTFPVPELLPRLDRRPRYSRRDVIAYLERQDGRVTAFRYRRAAS